MKSLATSQIIDTALETTDADLIRAIAGGDENALITLYERYRTILFGFLVQLLRDQAEAEDVLQEVFVKVWQQAIDFDEQRGRVFTWLVLKARSRAFDRLRSIKSQQRRVAGLTEKESFTTTTTFSALESVIQREQQKRVREALNELSEEQRSLLLMAYFKGLSQSEIALQTKIPLGTVKTRIRTGMMLLRSNLKLNEMVNYSPSVIQ